MCGLVFAGGKTSLTASEIGIFRNMLAFDQLRGDHSTGLFGLFNGYGEEREYRVRKDVLEGVDFVRTPLFFEAISRQVPGVLATSPKVTNYARVMFGHNRYATMGEVNARNAHPFTHGKITLAHNGTLRNQSLLPDSHRFKVDSENICYAIDKLGIEAVVPLLDGAFALIWYNDEEQTLNFLRNDEREFHLFETTTGDWFGCSEEKMGDWLLTRGKTKKFIKRHFELEPGTQYVFDVSHGCKLKEEVKHELPTFRSAYMGYSSGWGYQGYSRTYPTQTTPARQEASSSSVNSTGGFLTGLFQAHGLDFKKGDILPVEWNAFRPYKGNEDKGMLIGWLPQEDDYIEVQVHGKTKSEFTKNAEGFIEVISAFENKTMLSIIGKQVDAADVEEVTEGVFGEADAAFLDSVLVDDEVGIQVTESGERFTEQEWRKSRHNVCAACDNPIPFNEVDQAIILNGYCFCGECGNDSSKPTVTEEKPLGWCDACGEIHNVYVRTGNMTPAKWADLSSACPTKAKYKEKFMNNPAARQQLTLPKGCCTTCGEEVAVYKLKGGICTKCREDFQNNNKQLPAVQTSAPSSVVINSVEDAMKLSGNVCPHCKWTHTDGYLMGTLGDKYYAEKAKDGCPVVKFWAGLEHADKAELKTKSPMTVTKFAWENMNECGSCKAIIPFRHASIVAFQKGYVPLCLKCSDKTKVKDPTDE